MAEADFGLFGDSAGDIKRGVTAGTTPPNGGGNFTFGFHSQVDGARASGAYYNATNFSPLRNDDSNPTGGSVRGAMKRGIYAASATDYCIALFCCLSGSSVPTINGNGYMLGLSDGDPSYIVLAKGTPVAGLKIGTTTNKILAQSSASFTWDTWLHLRLDTIVNPNGDVILRCYRNDLAVNTVSLPSWAAIPGIDTVVDDALGVLTLSNPLAGGFGGWVFQSSKAYRAAYIDHFEIYRQR